MLRYSLSVMAILVCIVTVFCEGTADAQNDKSKATPGIKVGQEAPDFKLKDQNGKDVSLKDLGKEGKQVALVFYRSADW